VSARRLRADQDLCVLFEHGRGATANPVFAAIPEHCPIR